jgi:hypothetical protein
MDANEPIPFHPLPVLLVCGLTSCDSMGYTHMAMKAAPDGVAER